MDGCADVGGRGGGSKIGRRPKGKDKKREGGCTGTRRGSRPPEPPKAAENNHH